MHKGKGKVCLEKGIYSKRYPEWGESEINRPRVNKQINKEDHNFKYDFVDDCYYLVIKVRIFKNQVQHLLGIVKSS